MKPFTYDKKRAASHTDKQAPCVQCGRAVPDAAARNFVHVVDGGAAYGGPDDTNDAGDMGWFPVGATCARELRKTGVYVQTNAKKETDE